MENCFQVNVNGNLSSFINIPIWKMTYYFPQKITLMILVLMQDQCNQVTICFILFHLCFLVLILQKKNNEDIDFEFHGEFKEFNQK